MDELTDLAGVGRKTANVVQQHRLDSSLESSENQQNNDFSEELKQKPEKNSYNYGVVVDTHVQRLSRRLGLTGAERPEAIEQDLIELLPADRWQEFTHRCISHGRAVCTARSPDCENCSLEDICPSSRVDSDVDLASGDAWK
jgi:endonuclease-3